jgi:hypothetical protein
MQITASREGIDRGVYVELVLVPGGGIEPPRAEARRLLRPLRLPVPPSRRGQRSILADVGGEIYRRGQRKQVST